MKKNFVLILFFLDNRTWIRFFQWDSYGSKKSFLDPQPLIFKVQGINFLIFILLTKSFYHALRLYLGKPQNVFLVAMATKAL